MSTDPSHLRIALLLLPSARTFAAACLVALVSLSSNAAATSSPAEDPAAASYLAYLAHLPEAQNLADALDSWAGWAKQRANKKSPAEQAEQLTRLRKVVVDFSDHEIVKSETQGETATLELTANWDEFPMKGTVRMVREDGRWLIDEQSWVTAPN